jgi:methanogenic corrinoid protein MtbC1
MAFEAAGGSGGDRPVLVGLPPGARHEIASLAFATAARRAGLPVVYLGPDVPAASWVAAAERTGARAVAMGIVLEEDVSGGNAVVTALRATHPALVIAIGGRRGPLVGKGGVVQLPDGLDDAVAVLRGAIGS